MSGAPSLLMSYMEGFASDIDGIPLTSVSLLNQAICPYHKYPTKVSPIITKSGAPSPVISYIAGNDVLEAVGK